MPNYQCHKTTTLATLQGALASDPLGSSICKLWFTPCFQNHGHRHDCTKLACKLLPVKRNPILCKEQHSPPYINAKLNESGQIWSLKLTIVPGKPEISSYSLKQPKTPCEKKRQVTQFPKLSAKFLNRKISTGKDFESPEQETKTIPVLYSDPSTVITGAGSRQLSPWLHSEGSSYNSPSRHRSKIILHQWIKQIQIRRQIQSEVPFHSPLFF